MRQVAAFAFKRPAAAWLLITADEDARLDGLEAWVYKLFRCLVKFSDFQTGHGRTGYGELITALTPDQPAAGPRLWAPTRDDIKKALRALEGLGLASFDRIKSEKAKALFFYVQPRTRTGAPARKLPPELPPTSTEVEQAELTPRTAPGDSENKPLKYRACERPVDNRPSPARREALRTLRAQLAARGAPEASPLRGEARCPSGMPPRGLRPPESAQADSSPAGGAAGGTEAGARPGNTALEGGCLPIAGLLDALRTGQDEPGDPPGADRAPAGALA